MFVPRRKKRFLLLILTVTVVYVLCLLTVDIDPQSSDFHEYDKCPACYGDALCPNLSDLELTGWRRKSILRHLNVKNVFYGKFRGTKVVVKKLAHDTELAETDAKLCRRAGIEFTVSCNAGLAIRALLGDVKDPVSAVLRFMSSFRTNQDITTCSSDRLVKKVFSAVKRGGVTLASKRDEPNAADVVAYTAVVNPEPLVLQGFPQSEGWPFPAFLGTCGRLVIESYVGTPLSNYEDADWTTRVSLAEQLLAIAHQLTQNPTGFALYLTDVSMDNFAVDAGGKVTVVDAENIIVVDSLRIAEDQNPGWNERVEHLVDACHGCLSFESEELCSHYVADHNYFAMCSGILAPRAFYSARGGLLHSVPPQADQKFGLSELLADCDVPRKNRTRFTAGPALRATLRRILEDRGMS